MDEQQKKQVAMHKNLFDKCARAIENEAYFEAIMLEYAAVEGRLEALLGEMGMPCGRGCPTAKDIKLCHRIECLRYLRNHTPNFQTTRLDENFFGEHGTLRKWILRRNIYTHGLYKNPQEYVRRMEDAKSLAEEGYGIVKKLYNDVKRLRRLQQNHPEKVCKGTGLCHSKGCKAYSNAPEAQKTCLTAKEKENVK